MFWPKKVQKRCFITVNDINRNNCCCDSTSLRAQ